MNDFPSHKQGNPNPFGRIIEDDGSQARFRNMSNITELDAAVGPAEENRPDDVAKAEIMLDQAGFLDLQQTDGPTGFYGERLRQAIVALQKQIGLASDGRIVPGDDTHKALQQKIGKSQNGAADGLTPAPEEKTA